MGSIMVRLVVTIVVGLALAPGGALDITDIGGECGGSTFSASANGNPVRLPHLVAAL